MAVTNRNLNTQTFVPRWPDLESLSPDQVRLTYDRPTDTLFVDFSGEVRPAASIPLDRGDRDYLFLRVDPEVAAVVGLQIEHFLSYAAAHHPELLGALDIATLVGIGRAELDRITPFGAKRDKPTDPAAVLDDLIRLSA